MVIIDENIKIRTLTENDFSYLFKWLNDERILEFYGYRDLDKIERKAGLHELYWMIEEIIYGYMYNNQ